jgi:hypothetical protein
MGIGRTEEGEDGLGRQEVVGFVTFEIPWILVVIALLLHCNTPDHSSRQWW